MNEKPVRRNLHTYPFIYQYVAPTSYFSLEKAVIYIHIPFCTRKCHFCDYVVYTGTTRDSREVYVNALCKEIANFPRNRFFPAFKIDAIYIGGGTPGLLEAAQLKHILQTCRDNFELTDDCEIAVEFDPACVEPEKLNVLVEAGFNRFSMGVQTFDENLLKQNNRPHDLATVYRAWEYVEQSGFQHTNIDLIYPLFGLTLGSWQDSLDRAITIRPTCITAYPLEIWPDTVYHIWLKKNRHQLPDAQTEVTMTRMAFDTLEKAGFVRGSTSGYYHPQRSPRRHSRYLEYYWRTYPLIGFGVSSKSVILNRLYTNIKSMTEYIKRVENDEPIVDFGVIMSKEQEMRRVMIRGLKMCEVYKDEFLQRFGVEMDMIYGKEIQALVEARLLVDTPEHIYLTREGQVFSTNVWEKFFASEDLREPGENEVRFGISELVLG